MSNDKLETRISEIEKRLDAVEHPPKSTMEDMFNRPIDNLDEDGKRFYIRGLQVAYPDEFIKSKYAHYFDNDL